MYFCLRIPQYQILEDARCRRRIARATLSTTGRNEHALQFHVVEFDRREEAAAFVAALSRVLNSPRGDTYAAQAVEVWADTGSRESIGLFLSDAALDAAESAFSPVRVGDSVSKESASRGSRLIIHGGVTAGWGIADAELQLSEPQMAHMTIKENQE
jgi:hypothetical protein